MSTESATSVDGLTVSIVDALNEQEMVKFTVQTKTSLSTFNKTESEVTRTHEEFLWLHGKYTANTVYHGLIIPPAPPKPNFSASHAKLAKLQSGDQELPQEELQKLKQEIQSEYLSAFQKAVAMHEVFLIRLSHHPVFRGDTNLQLFLEYDKMMAIEAQSMGDSLMGMFSSAKKSLMSDGLEAHIDPDEFFGKQKEFVITYQNAIGAAVEACDAKVAARHNTVVALDKFSMNITHLGNIQTNYHTMSEVIRTLGRANHSYSSIGKKLHSKEDLKMADLLRYYHADVTAARELLVRRLLAFKLNKAKAEELNKAKLKGKKVIESQDAATKAKDTFEKINKEAAGELAVFKKRRGAAFRKGLIHYAQCQIRQSKESYALWKQTLGSLQEIVK